MYCGIQSGKHYVTYTIRIESIFPIVDFPYTLHILWIAVGIFVITRVYGKRSITLLRQSTYIILLTTNANFTNYG